MSKPMFSILHTSARPEAWGTVYNDWIGKARHSRDVEYVLCVDERWGFSPETHTFAGWLNSSGTGRTGLNRVVWNTAPYEFSGYVSGVNLAATHSTGHILIVVADDQFACDGWDEQLRAALDAQLFGGVDSGRPFVAEVSTGTPREHERGIMVMPILSRERYQKQGGVVFYPGYESMFADSDFCEWARRDGVVIDARYLTFEHKHWLSDQRERDEADKAQNHPELYRAGSQLFARRRLNGFGPSIQITKERAANVPENEGPITIALCLAGEHFQGQWLDGLLALLFHLIQRGFNVVPIRGYTSNVYATREEIRKAVMEVKPELALWLDDDNILSPGQFDQLFADLEQHPEVDGVTGWCWIHPENKGQFQPSCGNFAANGTHWKPFPSTFAKESELRPVEAGGFPCFLMRFSALEKAGDQPFIRGVIDATLAHGIGGEDLAFFRAAAEGGAVFLADPRVRVPHLKYVSVEPTFIDEGLPEVKIAVMMRVKNEARWIGRVIDSVKELGPVFVMDDGSTDGTADIAMTHGAVAVWLSPWTGAPLDERRDKNWLLQEIERSNVSYDYVLCIDGDEELERGGVQKIRAACQKGLADVYYLRFLYLWDSPNQARFDGRYSTLSRFSLFRVTPGLTFQSLYEGQECNQGLHTGNAPIDLSKNAVGALNVHLLHYGYMLAEDRARKFEWYNRIDPNNEAEDYYRHIIQGDPGGPDAWEKLKHAGPLELRRLPKSIAPDFVLPAEKGFFTPSWFWAPPVPVEVLRLNLGCSDALLAGFVNVDVCDPCDLKADLTQRWPWGDSTVDFIRAHDLIEHLPDKIFTMNEAYRVLKPGGRFEIVVPTTDGRGAYQDPTHVSFWNRNSFFYFEHGNPHLKRFKHGNGVNCAFSVVAEQLREVGDGVVKLMITLEAVKPSMAMAAD